MSTNDASDEESSGEGVCTSLESGEVLPASNQLNNQSPYLPKNLCSYNEYSMLLCDAALLAAVSPFTEC